MSTTCNDHRQNVFSNPAARRIAAKNGREWRRSPALLLLVIFGAIMLAPPACRALAPASVQARPVTSVQIDSRLPWQSADTTFEVGDTVHIAVTAGMWTYWTAGGSSPMQPGTGDDYICAHIMPADQCVEPMPRERKGALIGRIGAGRLFLVGQSRDVTAREAGLLELRINDPDHALWDNAGVLTVEIGPAGPPADGTEPAYPGPTVSPGSVTSEPGYPGPLPTQGAATRETPAPAPPATASSDAPSGRGEAQASRAPGASPAATPALIPMPTGAAVLPQVLPRTGAGGEAGRP